MDQLFQTEITTEMCSMGIIRAIGRSLKYYIWKLAKTALTVRSSPLFVKRRRQYLWVGLTKRDNNKDVLIVNHVHGSYFTND